MSFETRYAARMRQRADDARSTPEAAASRAQRDRALRAALADVRAKFPELNAHNAAAALDYQQERIDFHMRAES